MSKLDHYDTLVLSGGGTRGFLLLGAIQCAMDMNLISNVNTYVGTSIGAIIGYLLAIGYTPMELMVEIHISKLFEKVPSGVNLVALLNGHGAVNFNILMEVLEKVTLEKIGRFLTLNDLQKHYGKTLICTTYNMTTSQVEYLGPETYPDLPCLVALKMSSNLPLVFDRFKYMDCYYVDGGIADSFPILKGEQQGERVLALRIIPSPQSLADTPETGLLDYIVKILQIPNNSSNEQQIKLSKKAVVVPITSADNTTSIDFNMKTKAMLDMFSTGYSQFKKELES